MRSAFDLLATLDFQGFLKMFWFFFLFEIPRYTLSTLAVAWRAAFSERYPLPDRDLPVSVLLVGHNEGSKLRRAVAGLHEQSHRNLEIVVIDDGSTDDMKDIGARLYRDGHIGCFLSTGIRGGKASALNLGLARCSHELVVVMDIDTSLDRDAIATIVAPLTHEPHVGAVSGNLGVRNAEASLLTEMQAIEYVSNISLGRQFTGMFDILMIVSGAFGAFRKSAIEAVGGWDVGPGDDSNLTTKLRRSGWSIHFEPDAWALTDVPETMSALVKQRTRWSRSLIRNRLRKFSSVFDPRDANFSMRDVMGAINLLWFHLGLSVAFVIYVTMLFANYGDVALTIIVAVHLLAFAGDAIEFLVAVIFLPRLKAWRFWPYLFGFTFYMSYFQRFVRLKAYFQELAFRDSYRDTFYPTKVREAQDQF